ncbi:alcohol acetyltransferase [Limtongia smithiae]|uniref:alcohol acetyltransferase n=1 Tax=Limtongia smithiae TaxID=1125753 RepID=UPI0034CFDC3B
MAYRIAGREELNFIGRRLAHYYSNVAIWIDLVPACAVASKADLVRALVPVVKRHPALRTSVLVNNDEDTHRAELRLKKSIDLASFVEFVDADISTDATLADFLKGLHDIFFEYSKSDEDNGQQLWKVFVGNSGTSIFFVFDHAVLDGKSGVIFLQDLVASLKILESSSNRDSSVVDLTAPELQYLPLDITAQIQHVLGPRPPQIPPSPTPRAVGGFSGLMVDHAPGSHIFTTLTFSRAEYAGVMRACRSHGTTLTGYLHAAVLAALSHAIPDCKAFDTMIPVNARRFFKDQYVDKLGMDAEDLLGAYILQIRHVTPATSEVSWDEAVLFSEHIRNALKPESSPGWLVSTFPPETAPTADVVRSFQSKIGQPRDFDVVISNLGTYDFPDGFVARLGFSQCASEVMAPIKFNVVGMRGGELVVCVDATEVVPRTTVDAVVAYFKQALRDTAESSL